MENIFTSYKIDFQNQSIISDKVYYYTFIKYLTHQKSKTISRWCEHKRKPNIKGTKTDISAKK